MFEGRGGLESPCIPCPIPVMPIHNRHRITKRTTETEWERSLVWSWHFSVEETGPGEGKGCAQAAGASGPILLLHPVLIGCLEADMLRKMQAEQLTRPHFPEAPGPHPQLWGLAFPFKFPLRLPLSSSPSTKTGPSRP